MHAPEVYSSHLVCQSVDLSVNLSTSDLSDRLVLILEWKYQMKVGNILRGNKNKHFIFFRFGFEKKATESGPAATQSPAHLVIFVKHRYLVSVPSLSLCAAALSLVLPRLLCSGLCGLPIPFF